MRLYLYLDIDLIQMLAPKVKSISFDIDFFEYTEKRGYTTNNNTCINPEIENKGEKECRVEVKEDYGVLCNTEITKRYVNIEDISKIKSYNFYYNIVENLKEDNRIIKKIGKIIDLNDSSFNIEKDKFILGTNAFKKLSEFVKFECEVTCLGYKINCLNSKYDVFKTIAVYIE